MHAFAKMAMLLNRLIALTIFTALAYAHFVFTRLRKSAT
jgi:hypothetical protein